MKTKTNRTAMLLIGLSMYAILGFIFGIARGGEMYQPKEIEYQSTIDEYGEDWAYSMEMSDRKMIEFLSCPNKDPNGIRCQIWRNNFYIRDHN